MIPEYVLYQRLAQDATLLQLVNGRIMPPPRPQTGPDAALPAVVYQRVSPGPSFAEHTGPAGLGMPRVQYSCFASTDTQAWAVALAVRRALDGWSNRAATPSVQGVTVGEPLYRYEDDTGIHHVMVDAVVRYAI